jgi:hypothetical protein
MQVYRLASLDPEPLVKTLHDLNVLEPATKLQIDKKNRSIIAYASLADQVTIRMLIGKLDGSGRKFEVIPLKRLAADYVAGSIDFMLGGEKEKPQERRRFFYDYNPFGGSRPAEDDNADKFRVDADVEHNRLLLWANPIEMEEVRNLLVKLGEIPDRASASGNVRVLALPPGIDREAFLERLRTAWPHLAPNPLYLPTRQNTPEPNSGVPGPATTPRLPNGSPAAPATTQAPADTPLQRRIKTDAITVEARLTRTWPAIWRQTAEQEQQVQARSVAPPSVEQNAETAPSATRAAGPMRAEEAQTTARNQPQIPLDAPPVRVVWGYDQQLLVSSEDAAALDAIEDLLWQIAPLRVEYKIFQLKHASAFWVAKNLEEYFQEHEKKQENRRPYYFFDEDLSSNKTEAQRRLSKRRPLKFIDDLDTNTILVTGADANQLKVVEELIRSYDQPDPVNSQSARVTTVFTLRFAKAKIVADAVKDVYRDLLSSNDKALQGNQQAEQKRPAAGPTYIFNEGEGNAEEKRTQVSFKGKLSIGVDEFSNTLLVSTEGENLMAAVSKLIESLDISAQPVQTSLKVLRLGPALDSSSARLALGRALLSEQLRKNSPVENDNNRQNGQSGQQGMNRTGENQGNGQNFNNSQYRQNYDGLE